MTSILSFYGVALTFAILVFPVTFHTFTQARDRGFCCAKALGLIIATYIQGQLGRLGVDPWQSELLLIPAGIVICAWLLWLFTSRQNLLRWFKENRLLIFGLEAGFVMVFIFGLWLVAHHPGLSGTEKMMDFALLKAVSNAPTFPPIDPWFAGVKVNYYWLGLQSAALMGKLAGLPPEVTYNLMLAYVPALVFQISCGLFLLRGTILSHSLLGAALISLGGNLAPAYHFLTGPGGFDFNFWKASRIIPHTITEFPIFSLLVGDLHAHFLHLPFYLLFIYWLGPFSHGGTTSRLVIRIAILNLLFLVSALANPWSLPALVLLFAVYKIRGNLALPWFGLLPGMLLLPVHWEVKGYPLLLGWVGHANVSPMVPFLLMWGLPLTLLIFYLGATFHISQIGTKKSFLFAFPLILMFHSPAAGVTSGMALAFWLKDPKEDSHHWYPFAICGLLLITVPELVFIQDGYVPPFQRMNTVFKMHYLAWPLLMAGTAFAAFELSGKFEHVRRRPVAILLTLFLSTGFIYMGLITHEMIEQHGILTLNAFEPLKRSHPGDMQLIRWLDENAEPGDTCLEMCGKSYSWHGRIAALSNCNAILGWQGHEMLWRRKNPAIASRAREIEQFYGPGNLSGKVAILEKYNIKWIIFGELEGPTTDYDFMERLVPKYISKAFQSGDHAIYRVHLKNQNSS